MDESNMDKPQTKTSSSSKDVSAKEYKTGPSQHLRELRTMIEQGFNPAAYYSLA